MESREKLRQRVEELERQLAASSHARPIRKRAAFEIANLPFYDIAIGGDPARGEMRGHARGVIAIGDIATGVLAIGGLARGGVAIGGLALGLFGFGGLSIGALAAVGGLAIGGLAFGGGAIGAVAIGGAAAGYYACGGAAFGEHTVSAMSRDPQALAFFAGHDLGDVCAGR